MATTTSGSVASLLRLAWPLILSQSFWTVQIVLDRVLLSWKQVEAVGAGISAVMIFWTGLALFQYTASYATTFVAQYVGAGMPRRAGAAVGQAMWFAVVCGVLLLPAALLAEPFAALAGHGPEMQAMEAAYFRCLCFAALPILVTSAATSFFAGRGDTVTALWINAVGLVVNGPLAYVMIFGKLGFREMGIEGAGWATVAGTSASALYALAALLRRDYREEYGNGWGWGLDPELMGRLLYYGVPQGVGTAVEVGAFALFLVFIGRMGDAEAAATGIAQTLNLIAFLPMMGVGQAVEIVVGQKIGEGRPDDAEQAAWSGLAVSLAFTSVIALAYLFAPGWLAEPFRPPDGGESWRVVSGLIPPLLRFVAAYCLFDGVTLVFAYALRGAGDTRFVTWATILLSWPVMVLPAWLAWMRGWGMYPAWAFASLYVILLASTLFVRFRLGAWRSMSVIEAHGVTEPELPAGAAPPQGATAR
jgi:MATE family multidrug resistance protein